MSGMFCGNCKASVPDDESGVERVPCPVCGSKSRYYCESLRAEVSVHVGHKVTVKDPSLPSAKKQRFETRSNIVPSHKYGKLVRRELTIDRDTDSYSEKVTDLQTGEVLHECAEPLSQHMGHGSAKAKGEP